MPFRIESGFDPGSILARQEPLPDPQLMEANQLKLQQARNENSLFPMRKQALSNELAGQQMDLEQRKIGMQEQQAWRNIMGKYAGDYAKARGELATALRPNTLASIDKIYDEHSKNLAEVGAKNAETAKANNQMAKEEMDMWGGLAADVQRADYSPAAFEAALNQVRRTHSQEKFGQLHQLLDGLQAQVEQDPSQIKRLVDGMIAGSANAQTAIVNRKEKEAQTAEAQQKTLKEALETAARTAPDNQAQWTAWYEGLDPKVKVYIPAMFSPAALDRVRKLGLSPAEIEQNRHNLETESAARTRDARMAMPNTPTELAIWAADPKRTPQEKQQAVEALKTLERHAIASRPQIDLGAAGLGANNEVDPNSQSILAQTGLSLAGFMALTGQMSKLPRDPRSRAAAMQEAQKFANSRGVDVSTLGSQYKTYNDVLSSNIDRLNRTKIMEQELEGTIENLRSVVNAKDMGRLNFVNVAKIWAGQQVNDSLAQQYAMHLYQLRNELSAYGAASQGRSGNSITLADERDAEQTIRNGIAQGSLEGLEKAVKSSTDKMGQVMQRSVDTARKSIWDLFGVGGNYRGQASNGQNGAPQRPASIPANAQAQYSASRKQWRYSTDQGRTWQIATQ